MRSVVGGDNPHAEAIGCGERPERGVGGGVLLEPGARRLRGRGRRNRLHDASRVRTIELDPDVPVGVPGGDVDFDRVGAAGRGTYLGRLSSISDEVLRRRPAPGGRRQGGGTAGTITTNEQLTSPGDIELVLESW